MDIHSIAADGELFQADAEGLQNNLIKALHQLQHRELDAALLKKSAEHKEQLQPYFGFSISGEQFLISARYFCEVFADIPIAPLPNAPAMLLGLANLRGLLLPIYQLHGLIQRASQNKLPLNSDKPAAHKKKFVLVIGKGDRAVGLAIDALPISLSLALPVDVSVDVPVDVPAQRLAHPLVHPLLPRLAHTYVLAGEQVALMDAEQLAERLLVMSADDALKFQ